MKCLSLFPYNNIIIAENMDVYEVYVEDNTLLTTDHKDYNKRDYEEYYVRKLPMKAKINWKKTYGDDGTNNWFCDHLPWVEEENGKLIWDY